MADEKTFSESEHIAILSDRVAKETAELTSQRDALATEKSDLETKLDVLESAKAAAEQEAATAKADLEAFKAEIQAEREAAARKDERLKQMRESAEHLDDKFFEDEGRIKRIVAMQDADFEGYLADLKATAAKAPAAAGSTVPRETAMAGANAATGATTSAARSFLLGHYMPKEG